MTAAAGTTGNRRDLSMALANRLTMRCLAAVAALAWASLSSLPARADEVGAALDFKDLHPTFAEQFNHLPKLRTGGIVVSPPKPLDDPGFMWTAGYKHAKRARLPKGVDILLVKDAASFAWLADELATYPNGDAIAKGGWSPFSVQNGKLLVTADRTPAGMLPLIPPESPTEYVSGVVISYPYSQTYGYFEMRAQLPSGRGLWPAFWLLPADATWPPEIDVMEVLGHDPSTLHTTLHSNFLPKKQVEKPTKGPDLSRDFHQYGVDWGPETVKFYLDRRLVFEYPTPSDMHKPFYLLFNLGVGGAKSWPGPPDAATQFPAHMIVDSVRAWQRPAYERAAAK